MPRNVLVFQLQSTPMLFSRRNSLPACLLMKDLKVLNMSGLYTVIYASDTILYQLRLAHTVKYEISSKNDSHYSVTSNICDVNLMENRCSCSFIRTLMMPCRHIFAVRRSINMSIFEEEMVGQQ